ncbi:hypothetical protein [Amycolatopsis sp. cg9]|uniref:hypothetical protein n=1 Tax=Amycolatopsis sp. cg9 TaxID=3238801 RepID=UPI00352491F2
MIDCTITNWWAAYRRAVGSVHLTTAGVFDRYEPSTLTGSVLRPDLPDDEQPDNDSIHAAAGTLIT